MKGEGMLTPTIHVMFRWLEDFQRNKEMYINASLSQQGYTNE